MATPAASDSPAGPEHGDGSARASGGSAAPAVGQELTVDLILSLDGSAAGSGWPGWWGLESREYLDWLAAQPEHTALLGAATYRLFAEMARTAPGLDVSEEEKASFAQLDAADQIVFSSTLEEPLAFAGTRLERGDALEVVGELKRTSSKPLVTVGSLRLSQSLLRAGLVDRFRIVLFPVITGATGLERIWDHFADVSLELLEARTFEGGLQLLAYRPTPLEAPPGTAWER